MKWYNLVYEKRWFFRTKADSKEEAEENLMKLLAVKEIGTEDETEVKFIGRPEKGRYYPVIAGKYTMGL